MASTLLSSHYDQSSAAQMPNVFVVPPEEDHSPTWCYFNATDAPLSPASPFLDNPLSEFQAKSQALYDSAGPFGSHNATIMHHGFGEAIDVEDDFTPRYPQRSTPNASNTSIGNDSDVVEVVKVGRHAQDQQKDASPPPMKRSKSLKFRASKVLRSMKMVGKGSVRNKPQLPNIPSLPPMRTDGPAYNPGEDLPPRSKTPTVSRRKSSILSQLFSAPSAPSSVPTVDEPRPSFFEEGSVLPSAPTPSIRSIVARPASPSLDFLDPFSSAASGEAEYHDIRSASPTPSTLTFSMKRRFSVLGLHRLFSFSNDAESMPADPDPPMMSRDSSGPSTISSLGPDTPTEEQTPLPPLPYQLQHDFEGARKPLNILPSSTPPEIESGDISFEMRLDSFHFDALSFDADRF